MTKPRYPERGCAAGSQARGLASSTPNAENPADYAWGVNFNNGNTNITNRNNTGFVRAVRSVAPAAPGEFQDQPQDHVSLRQVFCAWRRARGKKRPSANRLRFESRWLDRLPQLQRQLNAGTWSPGPTACFIAQRPKAREIHAPDFADRIVHHLVVPELERIWEPRFIFDCYSNRKGKGTHAAVDRLQQFFRQVQSGQGGGWFLQLDVRNFFNSIDRRRLYAELKRVMAREGVPLVLQRIVHALVRHSPARQGVRHHATPRQRALVPPHKRLENAEPGCGLAIGNLSSQLFANIYLDALDQFVKHQLKAQRYLRYVDDFVLVHQDRAQLLLWQAQIETFLAEQLGLQLKPERCLKPLTAGCDFLGYVVHPTHRLVRRRVVHHAREALQAWACRHVHGDAIHATPEALRRARSIWGSYEGHLRHACARQARERLLNEFPWLPAVTCQRRFHWSLEGRPVTVRFDLV
jgi:RNA-directed DNA polymerase